MGKTRVTGLTTTPGFFSMNVLRERDDIMMSRPARRWRELREKL
jgi:hypothetical protein